MQTDGIVAPDGKFWYVPLPEGHDRAIFYRPYGTTWLLYCFARDDRGEQKVIASITLLYGKGETSTVELVSDKDTPIENRIQHCIVET